jgi:hypothetical protein
MARSVIPPLTVHQVEGGESIDQVEGGESIDVSDCGTLPAFQCRQVRHRT